MSLPASGARRAALVGSGIVTRTQIDEEIAAAKLREAEELERLDRLGLRRPRKPEPGKVHKHSREIARRLRQEARRATPTPGKDL
jgi:hypothetical protein